MLAHSVGKDLDEMADQSRNVFPALPQWRQAGSENTFKTVIEIAAKFRCAFTNVKPNFRLVAATSRNVLPW